MLKLFQIKHPQMRRISETWAFIWRKGIKMWTTWLKLKKKKKTQKQKPFPSWWYWKWELASKAHTWYWGKSSDPRSHPREAAGPADRSCGPQNLKGVQDGLSLLGMLSEWPRPSHLACQDGHFLLCRLIYKSGLIAPHRPAFSRRSGDAEQEN